MKTKLIGLLAIAFMVTASAVTVSAQLDDLPKLPHKKPAPGTLPDLRIESAKFYDTSVEVVIKNTGNAPSKVTGAVLRLYATLDPTSKLILTLAQNVPALAPGKEYKTNFGTAGDGVSFKNHARRIIIDPTNALVEKEKRNNELLSTGVTQEPEGVFPESGDVSDLTLTSGKFVSPAKVEFCVKNIGTAASTGFDVRTTIFAGEKKESGVYNSSTTPFSSLNVGEQKCFSFSFATYGPEEIFVNRSRLLEILPKGPDGTSGMKSYFETSKQPPWSPSH